MNNYITKHNYSQIAIVSHSRSGTNFLRKNLSDLLDVEINRVGKEGMFYIPDNPGILQVAVLRNPKDTILSSYSHGERSNQNFVPERDSVLFQIQKYLGYLNFYVNNDVRIYDFNNIENALYDIALEFIDKIPDSFIPGYPEETSEFVPTMCGTTTYKKIQDLFSMDDIWLEAESEYFRVLKLAMPI